ncbi:MAG: autotransporter-associated beta strand repeat-containing protein [Sphingobacteriaceae bacterium]|nr:autotransporter-associated beta strand repeat-containing protein [Sphingobacteriaceae bacterium]
MKRTFTLLCFFILFASTSAHSQRRMENLGRGVIATRSSNNEIFISWRLLGTEPTDLGFNIYRSADGGPPTKLNTSVLIAGTNWVDATANIAQTNSYFIKPVLKGVEQEAGMAYALAANTPVQPFFKIPIRNTPGYSAKFIWVGDLDGDGEYDFVFDKQPDDDSKVILLEAYKRDGTFLWQMDCGPNSVNKYNISPGSSTLDIGHGDNFTVYDINNDGLAEVIVRTANGVKFSNGSTVVDPSNDKQFISVLNGMTGVEMARVPYNNPYLTRGPMNGHMGIAYLDGINPSIVWEAKNRNADDSFNEMTTAWDWKNGALVQKWQFITGNKNCPAGHQIRIMDVNGDGKDDIIPMGFVINSDGTLLHSLGDKDIYHGDRFSAGDLDPARPGIEMFGIQQGYSTTGIMWYYCDAKSGQVLLTQKDPANRDLGRGMAGDFDPRYTGYEFYTFVDALYNVSGAKTSTAMPGSYPNLRFWWDGDLGSENLDGTKFTKWNYANNTEGRLYTASGVLTVGPNTPGFYGDILGDWREEAVYESFDHNYLVVYTTPTPTTTRLYTLPHNPAYRNSMTVKGYYQSNMPDYYLGYGMEQPPVPNIQKANKYWIGNTLVWDKAANNWTNGSANAVFSDADTIMFDIRGNNSGNIALNTTVSPARIWAMNPAGKDYTISGTGKLSGPMDLIKAQSGTLTIEGQHDYTGPTLISEGTLRINGKLESAVTIKPKGTLAGHALINGGLVLEKGLNDEGGRLSPGSGNTANFLGTLTIQGNLMASGNNNFAFDIVPGSPKINDSIVVKGNLSIQGLNKLSIKFANDTPVPGTYTLIKSVGTLSATKENFTIDGFLGVPKEIIIENNEVKLKILSQRTAGNIIWKGTIDGNWDYTTNNFMLNSSPGSFVTNDNLLFDESATRKSVTLNETAFTTGILFNAAGNYTITGNGGIAGTGDLTKSNTNTVSLLLANNTYTGKTLINGGTLIVSTISSAGEPSSLGSADVSPANLEINNAALVINDFCTTNRGLTIKGNSTLSVPTNNSYAIFTGEITGSGALIKEGSGSIYLTRPNSYSGQTFLKNGIINLRSSAGNVGGLGTSGVITLESGTLNMEDIRENCQASWNLIVPAGKTATFNTDGRCALLGTLTGGGTLNVNTPYVRTDFKGNWSAFTGKINISGNDFRIGNTAGYSNAALNLTEGMMYTITGSNNAVTIGELSGTAGTTLSGGAWAIGSKNTDAVFAGNIAGNSITKVGTGTWALTGNNMYTGATNINGGKLLVNNTSGRGAGSGTVTVAEGAILGGAGSIKGAVIINPGGALAPGNIGTGTLTDSTSVTFSAGSTAFMEINKSTQSKDLLKVVGGITFGGTLSVANIGTQAFAIGDSFKLFEAGSYQGNFSAIDPATPGTGLKWEFVNTTGTLNVIQDPASVFTLPAKNFKVSASSETCSTSNNGKIKITAEQPLNYKAIVNGTGTVYSFTSSREISDLPAGNYAVCINVEGQADYQQCFDVQITEPQALSVYSSINQEDSRIYLGLAGNSSYHIELNGKHYNTVSNTITLDLVKGNNELLITTDKACQGIFKKSIFIGDNKLIYPNPVDQTLSVNMGNDKSPIAKISLYSLSGKEAYSAEHLRTDEDITIDLSKLLPGTYIIKIKTALAESSSQIIKK